MRTLFLYYLSRAETMLQLKTNNPEVRAKEIARNVLKQRIHYHVSPEVIARDVEVIYEMMTDLLLPVFMSDRPLSVGRARIVDAIITGKYKHNYAIHRVLCAAVLKDCPTSRILSVYRRFEAVKNLEIGAEKSYDEADYQ